MKKLLFIILLATCLFFTACQKREILIGVILPETGDVGIIGQAIKEGIEVGVTEIQNDPDYPYRVRVMFTDSKSNPDFAGAIFEDLAKEGAIAVIGGVTSAEALRMVDVADEQRIVLLSPSASHPSLTGKTPYFFRIYPSDSSEISTLTNFTVKHLEPQKMAMVFQASEYADGFVEVFEEELKKNGLKDILVKPVPENMERHDLAVIETLTEKPDAVCIIGYPDAMVNLLKDLRNCNFEGEIVASSAITAPGVLARCGEMAQGIMFCKPPFLRDEEKNPRVKNFMRAYEERLSRPPGLLSAYGYDSFMVLAEAIKNGGRFREDVRKGLIGLQDFTGVTGPTKFNTKGDVSKTHRVYKCLGDVQVDYRKYMEYRRHRIIQLIGEIREGGDGEKTNITKKTLQKYSDKELHDMARQIGLEHERNRDELIRKILQTLDTIKL